MIAIRASSSKAVPKQGTRCARAEGHDRDLAGELQGAQESSVNLSPPRGANPMHDAFLLRPNRLLGLSVFVPPRYMSPAVCECLLLAAFLLLGGVHGAR